MKILRLLSKIFLFKLAFTFLYFQNVNTNEPVDIWSVEKSESNGEIKQNNTTISNDSQSIIDNLKVDDLNSLQFEESLIKEKKYLVGLFDPDENDLSIDMWEFSDGENHALLSAPKSSRGENSSEFLEIFPPLRYFPPLEPPYPRNT